MRHRPQVPYFYPKIERIILMCPCADETPGGDTQDSRPAAPLAKCRVNAQRLLDQYLSAPEIELESASVAPAETAAKLQKRKGDAAWAFRHLGLAMGMCLDQIGVDAFAWDRGALDKALDASALKRPSRRVCKSHVSTVIGWGVSTGLIALDGATADSLGFPEYARVREAVPAAVSLMGYGLLVRFLCLQYRTLSEVTTSDLEAFIEELRSLSKYWRRIYTELLRGWPHATRVGILPELAWPVLPSKRTPAMRARFEELPESLAREIELVLSRFRGDASQPLRVDRRGKTKKRVKETTVDKRKEEVLRHLGFVRDHLGIDLCELTLVELLSFEKVMARCRHSNGDSTLVWDGMEHLAMGRYQQTTFEESEALLRCIDGGEPEAAKIDDFLRFNRLHFESRREAHRTIPDLDNAFRVVNELCVRSIQEDAAGNLIEAAVLRRDAVILALVGSFAFRPGVLASIEKDAHVQLGGAGPMCLVIPLEITKRFKADGQYEIPEEVRPLLRTYAMCDLPRLAKIAKSAAFFVDEFGVGMSAQSITRVVTKRTLEVLGHAACPRAYRKAWARGWVIYSKADFQTAASVMDTSVAKVQATYAAGRDATLIGHFDTATIDNGSRTT